MPAWVVWTYLVGGVLSVWPLTQYLWPKVDQGTPWGGYPDEKDAVERILAAMFAVVSAPVWPLILAAVVAFYLSRLIWRAVLDDRSRTPDPEGSRHA